MASVGRTFNRASTRLNPLVALGSQSRLGSAIFRHRHAVPSMRRTYASSAGPEEQGPAAAQNLDEAQSKRDAAAAKATATMSEILAKSIKVDGPMTVASYMRAALLDPALGYYASSNAGPHSKERHVIGAKGDFVTSPEITQVFGEMFGIYFVSHYGDVVRKLASGAPSPPVRLVEFGPGRGTLLQDMLRTWQRFPSLSSNLQAIHLVEASAGLRKMQLEAVKSVVEDKLKLKVVPILPGQEAPMYEPGTVQVQWFDSIHSVPIQGNRYTMLMAHEFFDALPIHVFQKTQDGFSEVMVNLKDQTANKGGVTTFKATDFIKSKEPKDDSLGKKGPQFEYVLSSGPTPWSQLLASRNPRFQNMQPGQQVEISPDAWAAARKVGELVAGREAPLPPIPEDGKDEFSKEIKAMMLADAERRTAARAVNSLGGVGAIIDYGDEKSFPNSFRAFKGHQIVDPLESPGSADLTANVDFLHVKHAIDSTDAKALGPAEQGPFLAAMGLELRVNKLLAAAPQDRREDIFQAAHRVIDMNSMGKEYKVLGVKAPAYFAADDKKGVETPLYPFEYPEEGEQPPIVEAEGSQYS